MQNVYFVILCGGSGTRLWPLSRTSRPKQLLPFLNNKSLLEQTIDRISPLAASKDHIGVVTTHQQSHMVRRVIGQKIGFMITEPSPQNTAPAILLSCLEIEQKDPNAVVVFLPADHFIPETEKFCQYVSKAIEHAQKTEKIVTLGLLPTSAATGYGYIQAKEKKAKAGTAYDVEKFHEKPDAKKAQKYLTQGDMFWNLGMFVGKLDTFLDAYENLAPEIVISVASYHQTKQGYDTTPSISIDYAIMEQNKNIAVIPCDFEWTDVGTLETFFAVQQKYNPSKAAQIISIDGKNNIAQTTKKLVSFVGVENICVIEDGDVIVVAKRDKIEKVKEVRARVQQKLNELV